MNAESQFAEEYPLVQTLFGGYFHQDFDFDYGSPEDTIEAFVTDCRPADLSEFVIQSVAFLEKTTDASLERALDIMGNSFDYNTRGLDARQWVKYVVERVRMKCGVPGT